MNDDQLKEDARAYLAREYRREIPKQPNAIFSLVTSDQWPVTNRKWLVKMIASATALVIIQGQSPRFKTLLVEHCKKKRSADIARLVIEAIIESLELTEYADDDDEVKKAMARKLSAWASAVRYLVGERVPPSQIEALSEKRGEGVDTWARRNARPRKSVPIKLTAAKVTIVVGKEKVKWKIDDSRKLDKIRAELTRLTNAKSTA